MHYLASSRAQQGLTLYAAGGLFGHYKIYDTYDNNRSNSLVVVFLVDVAIDCETPLYSECEEKTCN